MSPRRYYPGFLAALFLVLLRVAIGWHFLYEGVEKIYSNPEGRDSFLAKLLPRPTEPDPQFSAEGYLRNATGPLARRFRELVPDVDSIEKLTEPDKVKAAWRVEFDRFAAHYKFNDQQRADAEAKLKAREADLDAWRADPETQDKVKKYQAELDQVDKTLANPESLSFERKRAYDARRQLDTDRAALAGQVDGIEKSLKSDLAAIAGPEATKRVAPPVALWTKLDYINVLTMGGMVAVGVCLILGLFTPLAALGAVGYLTLFYLSQPPWPHIPPPKQLEGHYLFVNKNLIELIACLFLAVTPSGHWIGLDALLFGARRRRRELAAGERLEAREQRRLERQSARLTAPSTVEMNPKRTGAQR